MSRFWTFSELGRERIKKSSRQSFFVLTWSINLSCCPVLSASFKFLAKRSNIGRKKTWNLVVIDRLYSSVLFWYLLTINCLTFVLVPSPRRLRKSEHFFLRPSTEELQSLSLRIFGMLSWEVEWIPRSVSDRADLLSRVIDNNDWRVKRNISLWPRRNGVLTLWRGLQIMKALSCPVSIAGSGALEQRRLMPFLFLGREAGKNNWLVPPFFSHPKCPQSHGCP